VRLAVEGDAPGIGCGVGVAGGLGDLDVIARGAVPALAGGRGDPYAHTGARADLTFSLACFEVLDEQRSLRGELLVEDAAAARLGGRGGVDSNGGAVFGDGVGCSVGAV
jgi:hypothetical protein